MPTQFQLNYLKEMVEKSLKAKQNELLASVSSEIRSERDQLLSEGDFKQIIDAIDEYFALLAEKDALIKRMEEVETLAESLFKKHLKPLNRAASFDLSDNSFNYELQRSMTLDERKTKLVATVFKLAENIVAPAALESAGKKEEFEQNEKALQQITDKIMLAMNMSALRKVIGEVNTLFGLELSL